MTITKIRHFYEEHREDCNFKEGELCQKILNNVIGFDLNPLAVMAARTNYLVAIRDLVRYVDRVEIPIYLCDSIMTPSEYGSGRLLTETGLAVAQIGSTKELKTAVASFYIPTEIATSFDSLSSMFKNWNFVFRIATRQKNLFNAVKMRACPLNHNIFMKVYIKNYSDLIRQTKTVFGQELLKMLLHLCLSEKLIL